MHASLSDILPGEPRLASSPLTLPLHTFCFNTIPPWPSLAERTAVKVREVEESTGWMPFLLPTSAKDIHWNSSFLQPPTDSWGMGHRSILCLMLYASPYCSILSDWNKSSADVPLTRDTDDKSCSKCSSNGCEWHGSGSSANTVRPPVTR